MASRMLVPLTLMKKAQMIGTRLLTPAWSSGAAFINWLYGDFDSTSSSLEVVTVNDKTSSD